MLEPEDFARPAASERRGELDRLLGEKILVGDALRLKLYRRDGMVVYATDHSEIGARNMSSELSDALGGLSSTEVGSLNGEGGTGPDEKALEAYVPVRFWDGGPPAGAFEIYQSYAPVAAAARSEYVSVAVVLGLGLLVLFVSMVPALRRVTRRLDRYVREIHHQALHDSLTGLPNRDAVPRSARAGDRCWRAARRARRRCC